MFASSSLVLKEKNIQEGESVSASDDNNVIASTLYMNDILCDVLDQHDVNRPLGSTAADGDCSATGFISCQTRDAVENTVHHAQTILCCSVDNHTEPRGTLAVKTEFLCDASSPKFDTGVNSAELRQSVSKRCSVQNPCPHCGKLFSRLKRHISTHSSNEKQLYTCDKCGKNIKDRSNWKRHRLMHSGFKQNCKNPKPCTLCGKTCPSNFRLKVHMLTHAAEKPYSCDICGQKCSTKSNFRRHSERHTGRVLYMCDNCGKSYTCKTSLNCHKWKAHNEGDKPIGVFKCVRCTLNFDTCKDYSHHVYAMHNGDRWGSGSDSINPTEGCIRKSYLCEVCGKCLSSENSLRNHVRAKHSSDGNFVCTSCGKSFVKSALLKQHRLEYHGVTDDQMPSKPSACSFCSKRYLSSGALKQHMQLHNDNPRYKCQFCGKVWTSRAGLTMHVRGHTGEKPFKCPVCLKGFTNKLNLQVHERCHNKVKPFSCTHCGQSFRQQAHLIAHTRSHTDERPFTCGMCSKAYRYNIDLRLHRARVHGTQESLDRYGNRTRNHRKVE